MLFNYTYTRRNTSVDLTLNNIVDSIFVKLYKFCILITPKGVG